MEPLQAAVPSVVARLVRNAPLSSEKILFAWRVAVGPAMARAAEMRMSADGAVEVVCGDDHWRREIRRSLPLIKERLAALLGADVVRKIKVPAPARKRGR